jgi:hypothetical protein
MTEAERAILRNQLAMMQIEMHQTERHGASNGSWIARIRGDLARRITSTQVALFDPTTFCKCAGRGKHVHTLTTSTGGKFVCDWCDREVPSLRHQYYFHENNCPAANPLVDGCICWHEQGTGPYPNAKPGDTGDEAPTKWRTKP